MSLLHAVPTMLSLHGGVARRPWQRSGAGKHGVAVEEPDVALARAPARRERIQQNQWPARVTAFRVGVTP
jgi:hypothetical protein